MSDVQIGLEGDELLGYWVLTLAAPFDSHLENLTSRQIRDLWQGEALGDALDYTLLLDSGTTRLLQAAWGQPDKRAVRILPDQNPPGPKQVNSQTLVILPFQALYPELKILAVDGHKPIWPSYVPADDPIAVPVYLSGNDEAITRVLTGNPAWGNLQRSSLTSLAMTGVTALVRATGWTMEREGILYPARDLLPVFKRADLIHISNEVPFAADCPEPELDQPDLYFCSPDRYIELLEHVGADVIELTGDHFGDWGPEAMLHTLSLYEQRGWLTYGGGRNLQAGLQPVTLAHNGNRLAFIGCNAKGGKYASATDQKPGSAECDLPYMTDQIAALSADDVNVIATMQHDEYYSFQANYLQIRDFRRLAEAGAAVVSGSQAHQPQTLEFYRGSFIHYGLGNLFFDQYRVAKFVEQYQHANKAFIDIHYFYRNRHISTELYPIKFEDYARARPMTAEEKQLLLEEVFSAQPQP